MPFSNPIVGGVTLIRPAIQSPNFISGSSGWAIKKDGSAEFNDVTIRGSVSVGGESLYYSPSPGAGNLIASISADDGADAFGNPVLSCITVYDPDLESYVSLQPVNGARIEFMPQNTSGNYNAGSISTELGASSRGGIRVSSPSHVGNARSAAYSMFGGGPTTSDTSILFSADRVNFSDKVEVTDTLTASSTVKVGAYVQRDAETWSTPSYMANWGGSGTFNGSTTFTSLQYRIDAEDNVWLYGCFAPSGAVGFDVFTLPVGYRPLNRAMVPMNFFDTSAGTVDGRFLQVLTNGNVSVVSTVAGANPAVGDNYFVNGKFPRGNIA